jgi:hypothetical protein
MLEFVPVVGKKLGDVSHLASIHALLVFGPTL